ncbi:MAG: hypothetical protein EOP41_06540 [Sphingobacteriaceae bacterium]|nr:MAG: hypothetical protein EOP41_06540 [Sphingobacteriaceae bacterium]
MNSDQKNVLLILVYIHQTSFTICCSPINYAFSKTVVQPAAIRPVSPGDQIAAQFIKNIMRRLSIIMGIVGLLLLAGGSFFYKSVDNAVDSGGTTQIVTFLNGYPTVKIPIFVGGVMVVIAAVFYLVSVKKERKIEIK